MNKCIILKTSSALFFVFCWGLFSLQSRVFSQSPDGNQEAQEFFEKKVRPLLESRCLECHSAKTQVHGGLILDSKSGWRKGGDSGPAIDVVEWQESLLWKAIGYNNPHLQMPPDGKLSDNELDIFRIWLSQGALDPRLDVEQIEKNAKALRVEDAQQHWAYRAIQRHPTRCQSDSGMNSIDAFLAVTQQEAGLEVSSRVAPPVLIQRLSVDLYGMRPTLDEIQQMEQRSANWDDATYQALVDQMLASPRFGERFARKWMDVVRFAESMTLRGFVLPDAWRYRNYLIDAFNSDKSYKDIVREQIAGDLMQSDDLIERQNRLIATTMLALGDTNLEEQDKKQLEMDYVDEQLDVIGKAFLAQTISCARCHDHKFDPIPTRDYYALAGILKSSVALEHSNVSNWVRRPLPLDSALEEQYAKAATELQQIKKKLEAVKQKHRPKSGSRLIMSFSELPGIVVDDSFARKIGAWQVSQSIQAYVGDGYVHDQNQGKGTKSVTFEPNSITPGTYRVRMAYSHGDNRADNTLVRIFSAEGEDVLRINQKLAPKDDGLWQTLGTYRFEQGGQSFVMVSNDDANGHVIADAIQFVKLDDQAGGSLPASNEKVAAAPANIGESDSIEALEQRVKLLQSQVDARPTVIGIRPSDKPSDIPIHVRGSVHQLAEISPRGFLTCVKSVSDWPMIAISDNGRLELAMWLTSDQHPLTARVYVNRVWSWLMGEGIVRTLDNFGTTGELPSDPALLDWLTLDFIEHGWSTKWLVRQIVCSQAYQRSVRCSPESLNRDPENRLFARSVVRRLDAESMRDTLLSASGELALLSRIESQIPTGIKEDYSFQHKARTRSLYGPWFRNSLPELISVFDGANPSFSISQRSRSTIAPQALALLHSEWVSKRCSMIGKRIAQAGIDSHQEQVEACFLSLLSRSPSIDEMKWALERLETKQSIETGENRQAEILADIAHAIIASVDFRFIE